MRRGLLMVWLLAVLPCAAAWAELSADQLVLVVNKNVPAGQRLAEHYATARGVPAGRIVALDLPASDQVAFEVYEQQAAAPLRKWLTEQKLRAQVKCVVTFWGVPLRVAGRAGPTTVALGQESQELRQLLQQTLPAVRREVEAIEAIARSLDAGYRPPALPATGPAGPGELDVLVVRLQAVVRFLAQRLPAMTSAAQRQAVAKDVLAPMEKLVGPAGMGAQAPAWEAHSVAGDPKLAETWGQWRQSAASAAEQIGAVRYARFDPASRRRHRELARTHFGLMESAALASAQLQYLQSDGSASALDSELSLLWWEYYSPARWQPNPHYWRFSGRTGAVVMVMRLDGPGEEAVRKLIDDSIRVEREGLAGQVVIDSRGISSGPPGKPDGYGTYDQTLRNLAQLLREKTKLQLLHDDKEPVLPAGSAADVALYCGWYSVRNYVPSCKLNPGAVGFHIASFEMVNLHSPAEKGWCRGLLADGCAATLGPVAEPYLHAFPRADEFFPLLLTGRLTLAETYWKTAPLTSWMMSCVGDPLYRPYGKSPPLRVEDLPEPLRKAAGAGAP